MIKEDDYPTVQREVEELKRIVRNNVSYIFCLTILLRLLFFLNKYDMI